MNKISSLVVSCMSQEDMINEIITYAIMECECIIERSDIIAIRDILKKYNFDAEIKEEVKKIKNIFDYIFCNKPLSLNAIVPCNCSVCLYNQRRNSP